MISTLLVGSLLVLLQLLAALPWMALVFVNPDSLTSLRITVAAFRHRLGRRLLLYLAGGTVAVFVLGYALLAQEPDSLELLGKFYAAVLQLQLTIDAVIIFFVVLLKVWPKGGAVAQAAFRESVRQPLFWLLFTIAMLLMWTSPFLPYFTFGEDHIMVKELGYDFIMLCAALFGTLAASMFISDEIEGRTAVTLMSKPVSRRQFLLGKFVGILSAVSLLIGLLGCSFQGVLLYKHWWDERMDMLDPAAFPPWVPSLLGKLSLGHAPEMFLRGVGFWTDHAFATMPGLVLSFFLVMILVALAVALATRVPTVVNLCTVVVIFVLANLSPVLVNIGEKAQHKRDAGAVAQILSFTSQLFDTILPGLSYFRVGPAVVTDNPPPPGQFWAYVGAASLYGLMYTGILLLLGLILFEDRDLA